MDGGDVGEEDGVACSSLLDVIAGRTGFDFDAEEVGGFALVEDEEDLHEEVVALNGFKDDYLVDLRLESGAFGVGHD